MVLLAKSLNFMQNYIQSLKSTRTIMKRGKMYKIHSVPNLVQAVAEKCGVGGERGTFIKIL